MLVTGLDTANLFNIAPSFCMALVKSFQLESPSDKRPKMKGKGILEQRVDLVDETEVCTILNA